MMEHTKEPWWNTGVVIKADGNIPAQATSWEDARRIVACVNACAGIPTEDLERWGTSLITKIQEDNIARLTKQRDELVAALEELLYAHTDKAMRMANEALASVKGGAK
jgi:hypothetical protein